MSQPKIRDINKLITRSTFINPNKRVLKIDKTPPKTPSPESIIRVTNKIEVLKSFKDSFQSQRGITRTLTPIPYSESKSKLPKINLTSLNIHNYGLGDNQAKVLSSAIRSMNRLERVNVRGNGMNDSGAFSILDSLNRDNIRSLDISNNKIGVRALESLSEILRNEDSSLEDLNLESSKISTSGLTILCSSLKHNKILKTLNLANNRLGPGAGFQLGDMLDYNNHLDSLDLQWNFIRASEAIVFFQALKNNCGIRVLDMSWNSMGHDSILNSIKTISEALGSNEVLQHLDLSNNTFSLQDCKIIADQIKSNHTIKGLHFEGNHGKVDSLGFIQPVNVIANPIISKRTSKIVAKKLEFSSENCWICNKWADFTIEWDPSRIVWNRRLRHFAMDKLSTQVEPVFIHLEADDYKPFLLSRNEKNIYFCTRALPQGKIRFFFTYRGFAQISNQFKVEACEETIEKQMHFYGSFSKKIMAVVLNYAINSNTELKSIPRPEISEYIPPPNDVPEPNIPPWQFENSIFAGFIQDPDLLSKCFEEDWNNSKLPKLFKMDLTRFTCKEMIRQEYSKM